MFSHTLDPFLPFASVRFRETNQAAKCKLARNIDHFLKAAGVVIQSVAMPTGVQRRCLFTGNTTWL
jgi:hypothetical protein